ncbi:hypothetical protein R3X26_01495 [Vibrio sp. TH_r3]|uniref:hypothetical protein n=1 Tax=Vibrio sp. TH_r3 TaxID=3082084 RepID=UPI0029559F75|nr:hypothetical protein [Vibrio sp. TH_r3]MDV7103075.1 hypothetical protein [Vibrio sp. TH_r3]
MSQSIKPRLSIESSFHTNNNVCSVNRTYAKNCSNRVSESFTNKHIKLTKKHINPQLILNRDRMLVEFGIKLAMLTKGIYARLVERGLEAYLLIIPLILLFLAL